MTFARRGDPWTSWAAAASVDNVTLRRQAVVFVLTNYGDLTDHGIARVYESNPELPQQSPSGLRTRRCELVVERRVFNSGITRITPSGRHSIVWTLDDPAPPPPAQGDLFAAPPDLVPPTRADRTRTLPGPQGPTLARPALHDSPSSPFPECSARGPGVSSTRRIGR